MDTLVLSSAYQPLRAVSWEKAMGYISAGKVEVIKQYKDRQVRTAHEIIKIPSIVRFLGKEVVKRFTHKKSLDYSKDGIWIRDNGECQYCGTHLSRNKFTVDHVKPRKLKGRTSWTNIVACCKKCNFKKKDMTLKESGMKLKKVPVQPPVSAKYFRDPAAELKGKNSHWVDFLY